MDLLPTGYPRSDPAIFQKTNRVAGKVGAVLFAGCVAGVEGEGKDVETECCEKSVRPLRAATTAGRAIIAGGFSVADAVT
jgi:hypothetical protein